MADTNNGFKHTLWAAADKLRGHLDAAKYKHVVLGLIFLKYISDAFQALHDDLSARAAAEYTGPEDRDEYLAQNVFWVPVDKRRGKFYTPNPDGRYQVAVAGLPFTYGASFLLVRLPPFGERTAFQLSS
jgi:type I restriction-modification system DNA methylase subunit